MIQYVKPKPVKPSGFCLIPNWAIPLALLYGLAILIGLIAALAVITFAPPAASYQESCARRSCVKNFGLVCKNNTCNCPSGYIFIEKCTLKKAYMEQCNSDSYCSDNASMICLNGNCLCSSSKYWNGLKCVSRVSYGSSCNSNQQCLENSFLNCDTATGKCTCNTNR